MDQQKQEQPQSDGANSSSNSKEMISTNDIKPETPSDVGNTNTISSHCASCSKPAQPNQTFKKCQSCRSVFCAKCTCMCAPYRMKKQCKKLKASLQDQMNKKITTDDDDQKEASTTMKCGETNGMKRDAIVVADAKVVADVKVVADAKVDVSVDSDKQIVILQRAECIVCREEMSSEKCFPALLACGHVATCMLCYEEWNTNKISKTCPICKIFTTRPPIKVDFNAECHRLDSSYAIKVEYLFASGLAGAKLCNDLLVDIKFNMSSYGESLKTSIMDTIRRLELDQDEEIPYNAFPEEHLEFGFTTQGQHFPLHGNVSLCDIGFTPLTHTLWLREGCLPINHYIVQDKLKALNESPESKFKMSLRNAGRTVGWLKGGLPTNIRIFVFKTYTFAMIADEVRNSLLKLNPDLIRGKILLIGLPHLNIMTHNALKLKDVKVGVDTLILYRVID